MFRVVIAEDEPKIASLIQQLIPWETLDLELIAQCSTGLEALHTIKEHHPDIVLTDINMPVLDGLSLIAQVRQEGLATSFVIISGYRQFDYAKKAIQYGVEEYLIKPINQEELTTALSSLCKKLTNQDVVRRKNDEYARTLRDLLMSRLVDGKVDLSQCMGDNPYDIRFIPETFQCLILALDGAPDYFTEEDVHDIIQFFRRNLDHVCHHCLPYIQSNRCIYFLCNAVSQDNLTTIYPTLFREIERFIAKSAYPQLLATLAVGEPLAWDAPLTTLVSSAMLSLKYRLQIGCHRLIDYTQLALLENPTPLARREDILSLRHYVECLDEGAFVRHCHSLFATITPSTHPLAVDQLVETILTEMTPAYALTNPPEKSTPQDIIQGQIPHCHTLSALCQGVLDWCRATFALAIAEKKARGSKPIYDSRQYVATHYASPITLEDIAQLVHLNSSYFSTLFKKETGATFSDYLAQVRIEEAKKLLRDTSNSIAVIGDAVGYPDSRYFSRVFTKVVGVKPSAYRTLHQ